MLEGATNGGELGALGMGFIDLGSPLCCVMWTRPKKNYGLILNIQRIIHGWEVVSYSVPVRLCVRYVFNPLVKKYIHIWLYRIGYPTDI